MLSFFLQPLVVDIGWTLLDDAALAVREAARSGFCQMFESGLAGGCHRPALAQLPNLLEFADAELAAPRWRVHACQLTAALFRASSPALFFDVREAVALCLADGDLRV
jgi:hypothetical protein